MKPARRTLALAGFALGGFALAAAADSEGVTPGAWERRIDFVSATQNGRPVPDFTAPEPDIVRRCVSPAVAKDVALLAIPPVRSGCRAADRSVGKGRIAFTGKCSGFDGTPLSIVAKGQYDPNSYRLDVTTETPAPNAPVILTVKITGRHVGDCTPEDPPIKTADEE